MSDDVKTFAGFVAVFVALALSLGTPMFFAAQSDTRIKNAHELAMAEARSKSTQVQCTCHHCGESK